MKRILAVVLGLSLWLGGYSYGFAEQASGDYLKMVELTIGQKEAIINQKTTQLDAAPYVTKGRTLVPFRFLGEALGAQVEWDQTNRQAVLKLSGSEVKVKLNSNVAQVNGQAKTLDVPAEIKAGRTFVPLRFISEALGAQVFYDSSNKQIQVVTVTGDWVQYLTDDKVTYKHPKDWTIESNENFELEIYNDEDLQAWYYAVEGEIGEVVDRVIFSTTRYGFILEKEEKTSDGKVELYFSKRDYKDPQNSLINYIEISSDGNGEVDIFDKATRIGSFQKDNALLNIIVYGNAGKLVKPISFKEQKGFAKSVVDGLVDSEYNLETTEAIMFLDVENNQFAKDFLALSDSEKRKVLVDFVQNNYGDVLGVRHCYTVVRVAGVEVVGADIGYESKPEDISLVYPKGDSQEDGIVLDQLLQ